MFIELRFFPSLLSSRGAQFNQEKHCAPPELGPFPFPAIYKHFAALRLQNEIPRSLLVREIMAFRIRPYSRRAKKIAEATASPIAAAKLTR